MEVNDRLIDKLSDLARLRFEGDEREEIMQDLNKMLHFIEKLDEIDTKDVQPLVFMTDEPLMLRADEVGMELSQEDALKNAPSHDSDYFKVPKVLHK